MVTRDYELERCILLLNNLTETKMRKDNPGFVPD